MNQLKSRIGRMIAGAALIGVVVGASTSAVFVVLDRKGVVTDWSDWALAAGSVSIACGAVTVWLLTRRDSRY